MFLLWLRQLPWCWDCIPASVPQPAEGRSSLTNTPVFPPSSFILLSFALFYYSFPLASYSCLLSAGVLHALLCLKVYSWCVCGERCTPHPPTPLPSCSSNVRQFFKEDILMYHEFFNKNSICGNSLWLRYVSEVGRVEVRAEAAPWEATMFGQRARAHGVQGHFSQSP